MIPLVYVGHFKTKGGPRTAPAIIAPLDLQHVDHAKSLVSTAFPDIEISSFLREKTTGYIQVLWHAHPAQKMFLRTLKLVARCEVVWARNGIDVSDSTLVE